MMPRWEKPIMRKMKTQDQMHPVFRTRKLYFLHRIIGKEKAETCGTGMEPPSKMTTLESSWETEMLSLGEELTDKDIPESEMHLYLRSEDEVAQLETLQREFLIGE